MKPQSPTRLVTKAFLPAVAALSRSCQKRDQEVRAGAHALPPEEGDEHVRAEHQHRASRRRTGSGTGRTCENLRVAVHVADRVEVDQRADAGDEQAHGDAERIGEERRGRPGAPPTGTHENRRGDVVGALLGVHRHEVEEHADRDDERRRRPWRWRGSRPSGSPSRRPNSRMSRKPASGQRRDQPDDVEHRDQPFNSARSSAVALGLRRKMATMMPRPTTTSAAATTSTKNTVVWPPMSSSCVAKATKREVHGVEHQLDAHEHHQRVAAHQHADGADGEQHGRRAAGTRSVVGCDRRRSSTQLPSGVRPCAACGRAARCRRRRSRAAPR